MIFVGCNKRTNIYINNAGDHVHMAFVKDQHPYVTFMPDSNPCVTTYKGVVVD